MKSLVFRHGNREDVIETDYLEADDEAEWNACPESRDRAWSVHRPRPEDPDRRVRAIRLPGR